MRELTHDDLRAFHAEILRVSDAGIPLELGSLTGGSIRQTLAAIEGRLLIHQSGSLERVLKPDALLSKQYIGALRLWVQSSRASVALEPLSAAGMTNRRNLDWRRLAFVQPLIWLVVAYLGFLIVCLVTVPGFEDLRDLTRAPVTWTMQIVSTAKSTLPIWAALLPVAFLYIFWRIMWRESTRPEQSTHSGAATYDWNSTVAYQASKLLQADVAPAETKEFVESAAPPAAAKLKDSESPLPPLLDWALETEPETRQAALGFVAGLYRGLATQTSVPVARKHLPTLLTLLGAFLVLVVSLSVFVPLIEMLLFVAAPQ